MRTLWIITKADFVNLIKNPMWVFYATGFPVLLVMILGYLTRNNYGTEITSFDYYGITLMLYAILNSGMTSSNAFMEERIRKPNMRIIYAPGNIRHIYIAKIISSFLFSFLFHTLDLLFLCEMFQVKVGNVGYLLLVFSLMEVFAVTMGIMICCIVKRESVSNQIQSIIVNIMAILGGLLFSLDGLGEFGRTLGLCSPVKWVVKGVFEMIYDHNISLFVPVAAGLVFIIAVMLFVCQKTFRKEDCIC